MTAFTHIPHTHTHTHIKAHKWNKQKWHWPLRGTEQAGSAGGRWCYCVWWKDEATQERREEAGEVNLLQLLRFTMLNPSRPVQGECMVYRSLTSVHAVCVRRKWLLMSSMSHLSCCASMLGAKKLDASLQLLSAIVFIMLRAQSNKWLHSVTCCPSLFLCLFSLYLLLYAIFQTKSDTSTWISTSSSVRSYGNILQGSHSLKITIEITKKLERNFRSTSVIHTCKLYLNSTFLQQRHKNKQNNNWIKGSKHCWRKK